MLIAVDGVQLRSRAVAREGIPLVPRWVCSRRFKISLLVWAREGAMDLYVATEAPTVLYTALSRVPPPPRAD